MGGIYRLWYLAISVLFSLQEEVCTQAETERNERSYESIQFLVGI